MKKQVIDAAIKHLKRDERLGTLIKKYPKPDFDQKKKRLGAFSALTRAIIFQQLSGKAAQSILNKFLDLYPQKRFPTPEDVLGTTAAKLRTAGVSAQKAGYLHDLAEKFLDGTVNPRKFSRMSDEEVFEHVVSVKGVGPWTTDMFLMFTLGRPDVLPTGDLGVQKGFQRLFNLRSLPNTKKMETFAESWRPYRTVACWYLWRLADEGNANRPD